MLYSLEWLPGHIIHTYKRAQYEIRSFVRAPGLLGHSYVFQICPSGSSSSACETFCAYFSPVFQVEASFGEGEEGYIHYLLSVLEFSLDQNPADYLDQNEQGQYLLTFQ